MIWGTWNINERAAFCSSVVYCACNNLTFWYVFSFTSQVLQTLGTETYRPSSASQCVAGIACAEIPMNQWPELIPQLVANVTNQHSTEHMKESTLEAIGYICQDIVSSDFCFCSGSYSDFNSVFSPVFDGSEWAYSPTSFRCAVHDMPVLLLNMC